MREQKVSPSTETQKQNRKERKAITFDPKNAVDNARALCYKENKKAVWLFIFFTSILCVIECLLFLGPNNTKTDVAVWENQVENMNNPVGAANTSLLTPNYFYRFDLLHSSVYFKSQVVVLALSTICFIFQVVTTQHYIGRLKHNPLSNHKRSCFQNFRLSLDGEANLELGLLLVGWIFIFIDPALASIRALRLFRQMYYTELTNLDDDDSLLDKFDELTTGKNDDEEMELSDEQKWFSLLYACQLCLLYIDRLGTEIFSKKSRGGFVVIFMFFFVTYIFAVIFRLEEGQLYTTEGNSCTTLIMCFIILMRLAFYDGSGFDFLTSVVEARQYHLAFLLFIYMILSAMVLLNGLINIFGDTFGPPDTEDIDEYFDDSDDEAEARISDENREILRFADVALDSACQTLKQLAKLSAKGREMSKESAVKFLKMAIESKKKSNEELDELFNLKEEAKKPVEIELVSK